MITINTVITIIYLIIVITMNIMVTMNTLVTMNTMDSMNTLVTMNTMVSMMIRSRDYQASQSDDQWCGVYSLIKSKVNLWKAGFEK